MKHAVVCVAPLFILGRFASANTISSLSYSREGSAAESFSLSYSSEGSAADAIEQAYFFSAEARANTRRAIMRAMTTVKAMRVLREHKLNTSALIKATSLIGKRSNLRADPKGYAALEGAKTLLNGMIFNSTNKYDVEIASCTEFYTKHCAAMESCRGDIAAANQICANARALILDAQACIERSQDEIVDTKQKLKEHLLQCKHEMHAMRQRMKVLTADIDVLSSVLEMTDCDTSLAQTGHVELLECEDPCTHKTYFTFSQDGLGNKMKMLQSPVSQRLINEGLGSLVQSMQGLTKVQFLQSKEDSIPIVNKSTMSGKPTPRTEIPADPCTDPNKGAPSLKDKRGSKCSITHSPQCYKLQERFLLIIAGVQDEHDELMDEISMFESYCEETKSNMLTKIANSQSVLQDCQTKLADATGKQATAAEEGRETTKEHEQMDEQLKHKMKTCSNNYINFETEICALKKIRAEIYKMKGNGNSHFQDCEVSKWSPQDCSVSCGGGSQLLERTVMIHPSGGMTCLPLQQEKTCNAQPCPVDCWLEAWAGWSACTAACGGGLETRLREVKMPMKFGGKPCSATSQTRSCNAQACEKPCELTDWTAWSECSKDCDAGTMKRVKFVKAAAKGNGHCSNEWNPDRLQYKECNIVPCARNGTFPTKTCNQSLDIILLIDGSGSLGKQGWTAEIKAANTFVDAFLNAGADTQIAVIVFSGPRTWSGVSKCTGKSTGKVSLARDCGIKTVTHYTTDLEHAKALISGMTWPMGSTLTSLALMTAKAEMSLGRKDSHTDVIVFTDGRPLSYRKTLMASRAVRKMARLLWVPVTQFAPLKQIKQWATRRWEENVVVVGTFGELEKPEVITHIIANICPDEHPKLEFTRKDEAYS